VLAHSPSLNQTRWDLNSDYLDRLLAEEFGILLLANNHLNKNGGKALYRILETPTTPIIGSSSVTKATSDRDRSG
jgi:hypothetical protein